MMVVLEMDGDPLFSNRFVHSNKSRETLKKVIYDSLSV